MSSKPDLQKLRRFALSIGLILITYSLAGVRFVPGETVRLLGLPLEVLDPRMVPVGLVLASIYSAARFFYYGVLMSDTPRQKRKQHWEDATNEIKSSHPNEEVIAGLIGELDSLYPKGRQVTPIFPLNPKTLGDFGDVIDANIDIACHRRALAYIHDIDYWAPVWFNVGAVVLFVIFF